MPNEIMTESMRTISVFAFLFSLLSMTNTHCIAQAVAFPLRKGLFFSVLRPPLPPILWLPRDRGPELFFYDLCAGFWAKRSLENTGGCWAWGFIFFIYFYFF